MSHSLLTSCEVLEPCVGNLVLGQTELDILALELITKHPNMLTL
jgi:hypothetical protein